MKRAQVLARVALFAAAAPARAADPPPAAAHAARLAEAQERFGAGDYAIAAVMAGPLTHDPAAPPSMRAEALRLYGLALFMMNNPRDGEAALLAYLRLEPDAHLDPAQVPPEAIVFFEDVRARHAGEVALARPRHEKFRTVWANLLPPWGQFQNGDRARGWVIGFSELLLLATNLTTYALLVSMCSEEDGTCSDPGQARTLRFINHASGVAFVAVVAYGILDGYLGYQATSARMLGLAPADLGSGASFTLTWAF